MKNFIIIIIVSLSLYACKSNKDSEASDTIYKVFYFQPTARCESCINIENFTKELITTNFASSIPIAYESMNIDETGNEHYKNEFNLNFSSVIIAKYKNGQIENFKNLDSVWSYSDDKNGFMKYASAK